MKKLIASLMFIAAPVAASTIVATASAAHAGVEINSGWCQKGLPTWQHPYLAPGQNQTGPFVIVDGRFVSTNGAAWQGYMGCYK